MQHLVSTAGRKPDYSRAYPPVAKQRLRCRVGWHRKSPWRAFRRGVVVTGHGDRLYGFYTSERNHCLDCGKTTLRTTTHA